jgi:hypothetical protein
MSDKKPISTIQLFTELTKIEGRKRWNKEKRRK